MKLALLGGKPVRNITYPEHSTIIDDAEEKAVIEVLRGGHLSGFSARPGDRFLGGEKIQEFEKNLAEKFGVKHAITFNSATSALHGCMAAIGIGPGDEVITSSYTMSATPSSILMTNGVPVFADIETSTFGLAPESVEKKITPYTKAILTVNLFGHPSRLDELKEIADRNNLILVEDNAQSPGIVYNGKIAGTVGAMGVLSFNYHKAIQTGEGGVVITNNSDYAEHLQLLRNHAEVVVGKTDRTNITNLLGWNYRLTEVQAAIGIEQLKKLDFFTQQRQELANYLTEKLTDYDFLQPPVIEDKSDHGYYLYPIKYDQSKAGISRELFVKALHAEGISVGAGYVKPIYLEPMFQTQIAYGNQHCPFSCPLYKGQVDYRKGLCPETEKMHFDELLTTDICKYPNTKKEADEFSIAVEKIVSNLDELKNK
jgi:dTDP-4-amino-4,6-dideoxygalactose transaminase